MNDKDGLITRGRKKVGNIFNRILGRSDDEVIIRNMGNISNIFDKIFGEKLSKIAQIDAKRIAVAKIISNDNLFLTRDPNAQLVLLVQNTYRESKGNSLLFLKSLRAKREWIKKFEGELSEYLLSQLERTEKEFGNEESFRILIELYLVVAGNADRDYVVGFIKTPPHQTELRNAVNRIKHLKIKKGIREIIAALTEEELTYLTRYLAEVASWHGREAITEDIEFFKRKANSFLYGQAEPYLGLLSYFKDEKLEQLKSNPAHLQLDRYNLMLLYLRRLRNKISAYKTGDWTQFEEVYNNVKKIANTFIREFGNSEIGQELFEEKKEFREYPERWLYDMDREIAEISSPQYRKAKVIVPFIAEIERIFNLRINELRNTAKPEIAHLKEALKPLIKLEKNSSDNILKETSNFRRKMRERIKNLRNEFDALSNIAIDALYDFVNTKDRIVNQDIRQQVLFRLQNAQAFVRKEKQYIQNSLQTIGPDLEVTSNDPIRNIALLFSFDKAFRATAGTGYNLRSIGAIFTQRSIFRKINELNRSIETADRGYSKLNSFITEILGFLVQPSSQVRREDYATTRTEAA